MTRSSWKAIINSLLLYAYSWLQGQTAVWLIMR
jgi:hypothetical protein